MTRASYVTCVVVALVAGAAMASIVWLLVTHRAEVINDLRQAFGSRDGSDYRARRSNERLMDDATSVFRTAELRMDTAAMQAAMRRASQDADE